MSRLSKLYDAMQTLRNEGLAFNNLIHLLENYFVRRNITDYPNTRDLTRIFMDIISKIENAHATGNDVNESYYRDA